MLEIFSMIDFTPFSNLSTICSSGLLAAMTATEYLSGWGSTFWNIFQVAIGLGFVIFVHELGHFLAAKFFGVKCEKFYVGFDVPIHLGPIQLPAKLFHFQWGETEYGIGSIPLGGYVKMLGQDDDPRNAEKENERIRVATSDDVEAIGRAQYDPRSFPAKSVFARMVIISAGVVMNILFGILFAAVAFNIGVPYEPTIIGDVTPGDPAWQAGLQSGDRIVQLAEMKNPDANLSFDEMRELVFLAGLDNPKKEIPVIIDRAGKQVTYSILGTKRHDPSGHFMNLGVSMSLTTKVHDKFAFDPLMVANWPDSKDILPALQPGDTIVGVNGVSLPVLAGVEAPLERDLNLIMHPLFDKPITLQVERRSKAPEGKSEPEGKKEHIDVTWNPLPMRTIGIGFQAGPITAVQAGSDAEKAGVAIGDTIVALDGTPIDDALTLPLMVAKKKGESVKLTLKRGPLPAINATNNSTNKDNQASLTQVALESKDVAPSSEAKEYSFEWRVPDQFLMRDTGLQYSPVGLELAGSGLVFAPLSTVSRFTAMNDSDTKLQLKPGDQIQQVRIELDFDETKQAELKKFFGKESWNELVQGKKLEGGYSAQYLHSLVQHLPLGTKLHVYFMRDNSVENVAVQIANDPQWSWYDRGLLLQPAQLIHQANSFSEAMSLGVTEIVKKGSSVLRFLRMAVSWKIPRKAAAGPAGIFYAATSAASESTTKLLLFLTMLSANLAILNFLPIPALDGGHMMFLIAEAIRGKPVNEALQMRLTVAGVLALLALMIFVTFNDVSFLSRIFG
jgi:regulator of sigma E protease